MNVVRVSGVTKAGNPWTEWEVWEGDEYIGEVWRSTYGKTARWYGNFSGGELAIVGPCRCRTDAAQALIDLLTEVQPELAPPRGPRAPLANYQETS